MARASTPSPEVASYTEPTIRFRDAIRIQDEETPSEGGIRESFYMKRFGEDPEEFTLWPSLPMKDGIHAKIPSILRGAQLFSYSKKRGARSLILGGSPLTESNLLGRSLASIVLDPHDVHKGEDLDFKRRDEDGIPIVTLKDIHSEADPEYVAFHSKGIWSDPNKQPGEPDVWPPPHLAMAIAQIYAPDDVAVPPGGLTALETVKQIPVEDSRPSPPPTPPPRVAEEEIFIMPDSPTGGDSCPGTPLLVPDVSPASTEPATPATASFLSSFQSMNINILISHPIEEPNHMEEPQMPVFTEAHMQPTSPSSCSTATTLSSPSPSATLSEDSTLTEPTLPPPSNRSRLEDPNRPAATKRKRQANRAKPGTRFKAVVFPQATALSPTTGGASSSSTTPSPASSSSPAVSRSTSSNSPSPRPPGSRIRSCRSSTSDGNEDGSVGTITIADDIFDVVRVSGRLHCPMCPVTSKTFADLMRHVRGTHDPDYPGPKCPLCYKPLSRSDAVKRHIDRKACGKRMALQRTLQINKRLGRT